MLYAMSALVAIAFLMIFVRRPWHLVASGLCGLASSCLGLIVVVQHIDVLQRIVDFQYVGPYVPLAIPMLPAGIFATITAIALCSWLATSQTHVSGTEVAGDAFDATRA